MDGMTGYDLVHNVQDLWLLFLDTLLYIYSCIYIYVYFRLTVHHVVCGSFCV